MKKINIFDKSTHKIAPGRGRFAAKFKLKWEITEYSAKRQPRDSLWPLISQIRP